MESKYKILIVDDEPDIIEILDYNLKKEGYHVLTADNGEDAIKVAKASKPDLIVLDVMMPGMDGMEVCDKIRNLPELSGVLITFLTARSEDYSQIAGFEAGADDYITKPVKPKVFLSKVKALLRRRSKEENNNKVMEFGDLKIDLEKYEVIKGCDKIVLPKKEFELLSLLASKPSKVFTREEILDLVWGSDVVVGGRTIDVHIRKIREKLGDEIISTIKGVGYKFDIA
ncbi:response regulator transcription factor [Schleiferia thermophila]|jgi:two-component system alkaline phosphatase synthesis response regulator PhoP|uniref:Phosphate regulon transcriptional regulatory protein PhoB n=1 Tax=Schleiferia thermophila TaxID=884107 RepID=A0A369A4M7_9FLAO|nr:response regulator transcription factor [Schleiferia thermophila]PMB31587.1 DNA-binding response regulator [Fischerella thermalis CCMEE 5319]RCX03368.1 two-component system alkaline phosphatase synthesis response regulator PhoP [Schleiferia thermophila]GCD80497.1 DNA-binding response regulator [Schleiferia thermophila]